MKTTSDYIRELDELKQTLRLNDRQIAARIGVSAPLLSLWRRGKAEMSNKNKDRIFAFFASPEVVGILPQQTVTPSDPLLDYVNGAWPDLTAEEKAEVVAVIERAKEKKTAAPAADSLRA